MNKPSIRETIHALLAERGHIRPVGDDESLFFSGLLDSLAATQVMLALESDHGIDLADSDFDIARLDTIAEIEGLTR
jgi:acyl carrier protein